MKSTYRSICLIIIYLLAGPSHSAVSPTAEVLDELNKNALIDKIHHRKFNLRLSIPGLLVGWTSAALDIKVNRALMVGPTAKYFVYGPSSGFAAGVQMNYALNGDVLTSGWLLNPYFEYYQSNYDHKKISTSGVIGGNLAYQWMWENGFNLQLGGGLAYSTLKIPVSIGNDNIHPNFDFTIGYSF